MVNNKHFVFTYFWDERDVREEIIINLMAMGEMDMCKYISFQEERCPTSGELHLQGYVEFAARRDFGNVHELLEGIGRGSFWIKLRRASRQAAMEYTQKLDTRVDGPWEGGIWVPQQQGAREDLQDILDMVQDNKSNWDIFTKDPGYLRFHKHIQVAREAHYEHLAGNTYRDGCQVIVINGATGLGKTQMPYDVHGIKNVYRVMPPQTQNGTIWFTGYTNQKILVIDEFEGWMPYRFLLTLLDRYPVQVQTKGGHAWIQATHIYITTTKPHTEWYPYQYDKGELMRRITHIHTLEGPVNRPFQYTHTQ